LDVNRFLETLKERVMVCDGAMGTQLIDAGMQPGECPEAWNLEHADELLAIQKGYIEAGADIVITNTFGGNRWTLARHGKDGRLGTLNSAAVEIARKAAGESNFVAGDIGPTGELPQPYGTKSEDEFLDVFAEQARVLASAGVDAIFIQTQTAVEELSAAVRAAKEVTDLPVCASASYSRAAQGDSYRTMMGASVEIMVEAALTNGADIVGANCGSVDISEMVEIVKIIRGITKKYILVEPNAGKPVMEGTRTTYPQTPEQMAEHVRALIDAGASIIGGCCGTTTKHVAAIARVVKG